jgi:putative cell wall-binding protein
MDFKHLRHALVTVPTPPSCFALHEWYLNNCHHYRTAKDQQQKAAGITAEANRLCDLISEVTKLNKAEVDNRLGERIKDTEYRKKENEIQKEECCKEEEALLIYKERLMGALVSLKEQAQKICKECITLR